MATAADCKAIYVSGRCKSAVLFARCTVQLVESDSERGSTTLWSAMERKTEEYFYKAVLVILLY